MLVKYGSRSRPVFAVHHLFMASIFHRRADIGCAPVLPDNGVMNCLAGGAVPDHRRLALVCDPYGDGKAAAGPCFFNHRAGDVDGGLPDCFGIMFNPSIIREDLRELCRLLGQDSAGLIEQDGTRAGGSLVDGNDGTKVGHDISGSCPGLALWSGAAAAFRFQILFPFLMRLEIGKMNVQRGIRDLDFTCEQQHRSHHQQDRPEEQDAGYDTFIEIGGNHRAKRENKGNRRAGLDDPDKAKSVAKPVDLKKETFGVCWRDIVAEHLVMKMADQIRQHGVAVAEIYHHQRNRRKQHANNQYILLHCVSH